MQGLLWRLRALDPEATETLKVIAYFDALVNHHASMDQIIKGAAALSGCVAGFAVGRRTLRVDPLGTHPPPTPSRSWPVTPVGTSGSAWLEREGHPFVNDPMILERVGLALTIAHERTSPVAATARSIECVTDSDMAMDQRADAAQRLHLDPTTLYRVHATPLTCPSEGPSAVRHTDVGSLRIALRPARAPIPQMRVGVGLACHPQDLPRSWSTAFLALRLTTDSTPQHIADDLGGLLVLAEAALASDHPPPDVERIHTLGARARDVELLEALTQHHSLRAVATHLGLHHSTVQARVKDFEEALGFDPVTLPGRVRLTIALTIARLSTARF